MDEACGTYEAEQLHKVFWWGDLRKGDHLDLGIDGRIILKRIFKMWDWEA
jgi:hypothetical protein